MWPFRFLSLSCSKSGSQKSWTTLFTTPFTLRITLRRELTLFTTPFSTLHQERLPKYRKFLQGSMNLHHYCESRLAKKQELKYFVGIASPFSSTKNGISLTITMHHWLSFKWVHLVYKFLKGPILAKYETRGVSLTQHIQVLQVKPKNETTWRLAGRIFNNHMSYIGWSWCLLYMHISWYTIHTVYHIYIQWCGPKWFLLYQ